MIFLAIGAGCVLLLIVFVIVLRNKMIGARNLVEASFADIDAQLLNRYELIQKLIQIAQGYASHEAKLLEELAEKRSSIWSGDDQFPQILSKINVIKEAYPDLKADLNFEKLLKQIRETEDHLLYSRQFYNGTVEAYNRMISQIPYSFFRSTFGHSSKQYVQATNEQQSIPTL
ncbi:LemA family protein [Fluviicola taffensis]|jgi:LemA protein|uniref:LemA family protein n=1 Tax=Fluviicola taffensis (strain DSM 16823 / NCIMB 13979 / RW262) TaxID=755732 RepID=F2IF45_FLUTR|nr:LemA family protein [Fluviicola taffensis]AEA43519.1 LemA family protein [Fluviicola taffensis DSM 16823]